MRRNGRDARIPAVRALAIETDGVGHLRSFAGSTDRPGREQHGRPHRSEYDCEDRSKRFASEPDA